MLLNNLISELKLNISHNVVGMKETAMLGEAGILKRY